MRKTLRFLTLAVVATLFCLPAQAQLQYWPDEFESTCGNGGPYSVLPTQGAVWLNELTLTPVSIPYQPGTFGYSGWIWTEGNELVVSITGQRTDGSGLAAGFVPFELRLVWDESAQCYLSTRQVGGSIVAVWAAKWDNLCNFFLFNGYLKGSRDGFEWYSWRQVFGPEDAVIEGKVRSRRK